MRHLCLVIGLLAALAVLTAPSVSQTQIISITIAPPELPLYEQPAIPAPGYMWAPGYWAYGPDGYFWVPGTWVLPPLVGLLWTPGYWSWRDGYYVWNDGYWGPQIGFYGGVYYGFGYDGVGYEGGYWNNGVFVYNQTVNNFGGVTITNVYRKPVIVNTTAMRVSFNGGVGGTTAQPTPQQRAAAHQQHVAATRVQTEHQRMASANRALLASENRGRPSIAATSKPGEFTGKGVVAAREMKPRVTLPGTNPTEMVVPEAQRPARSVVAPPNPPGPVPATVRPVPSPPRPVGPAPVVVNPVRVPPPPHLAGPPAGRPVCPPGKTLAEVNGHQTCK